MPEFTWSQLLVTAATSAASVYGGAKLARYSADLNRQRVEKQAAAALRSDLERIQANLGRSADAFGATMYGMTFAAPTVHRWAEPLIIQLAVADPRIVAGYMDLDRELSNFAATLSMFALARDEESEARAALQAVRNRKISEDAPANALLRYGGAQVDAEGRVAEAHEMVKERIRLMREPYDHAKTIVNRLLQLTTAIVNSPEREFLQLPEEGGPKEVSEATCKLG